jgi:putative Mg2+ transporter-C (MgtC) family protein
MRFIDNFNLLALSDTLISVATSFVLGSIIGFERQYRQRTAGLRTNALVAVGATVFVDLAGRINGNAGTTQVVAYVVSGVGFLGAGAIMKDGMNIQGLNTAATLWGSAAVGACSGAGLGAEALLAAVFVLSANTLLRPVGNILSRTPIDEMSSEMTYQMCIITSMEEQKHALTSMEQLLDVAKYPTGDIVVEPFGEDDVEIRVTLLSTSVDAEDLDRIIAHLSAKPYVSQAFWNPVTSE